jgi:transposase
MAETLNLESRSVAALPLLQPLLERLRLRAFLEEACGRPDPRLRVPHADCALLLVRNFTLSRHPLYGVGDWARPFDPHHLGLSSRQLRLVNDDRLGRTLDRLFKADLRTAMTRIVVHMVRAFGLDLKRLHNDSTTLTFSGVYAERPPRPDGRRRLKILHGHNKDHRPDLKQLVWALTISSDGAVPIHYHVYDGNVTDDRTHLDTWEVLRAITGSPRFLYVADAKLCTKTNMAHIHEARGRFLTVLPRTRKEDARFKEWIVHHPVDWEAIWDRPPLRRQEDPPEHFETVEAPEPSAEGYRIVWYRSSEKWKRDERARDHAIHKARGELDGLRARIGKRSLKSRDQIQAAVDSILDQTGAYAWLHVELVPHDRHTHKQAGPGRPGKHTRYVRHTLTVHEPVVTVDEDRVRASAAVDGIFPLITNIPANEMPALELLKAYKYQSFVEKRHEQLKTAADVVPVHYKRPERIEAFLFLYFLAVMIQGLLEREVRVAMRARKIRAIHLYPEERECRAPTADKILALFEPLRLHRLSDGRRRVKTFWDPLTDVQRTVLELLAVPASAYGQ